jgi:cell division protein FtsL
VSPTATAASPPGLSRAELVIGAILLVVITVAATLLVRDWVASSGLPLGCSPADKGLSGCRPTSAPVGQYALTLGAVVITPLVALIVAAVTVRTTDRRQAQQLTAEQTRLETQIDAEEERLRRDELRRVTSECLAALLAVATLSRELKRRRKASPAGDVDAEVTARIEAQRLIARVGVEQLRLLCNATPAQGMARYALRHNYAIYHEARTGTDNRASEYPGTTPSQRFEFALHWLYVEVRRELGVKDPDATFRQLD